MKRVIVISSILFFLALTAADAAPARRGHMNVGMMDDESVHYSARLTANPTLKLTAEQASQIRELDDKYAQEMKSTQTQMYNKGNALKTEWLQARPDRDKITALQCEVSKLRDQMREKMTNHRTEVRHVLTLEQQAQVPENLIERGFYKQAGFGRQ